MTTVRPPSPSLIAAAENLDRAIASFLAARTEPEGVWEALDEAVVMMKLLVRQVEGLVELARCDEVLLPPAWACARSAAEIGSRLRWLTEPVDPFDREARWLARIAEEERLHQRAAKQVSAAGSDPSPIERVASQVRVFRENVAARMPSGIDIPGIPSIESSMSHDLEMYALYREASQYVHGTHASGVLYRRHLGVAKELGEQIQTSMWEGPLRLGWWGLATGGASLLDTIGGDPWPSRSLVDEVETALRNVEYATD